MQLNQKDLFLLNNNLSCHIRVDCTMIWKSTHSAEGKAEGSVCTYRSTIEYTGVACYCMGYSIFVCPGN